MTTATRTPTGALGSGASPRARRVLGVLLALCALSGVALLLNSQRDPSAFRDRTALPSCGDVEVEPAPIGLKAPAREAACFNAAIGQPQGAELRVVEFTTEGDPVANYYRALPGGGVEIFIDSIRDSFGGRAWGQRLCPQATALDALSECDFRSL